MRFSLATVSVPLTECSQIFKEFLTEKYPRQITDFDLTIKNYIFIYFIYWFTLYKAYTTFFFISVRAKEPVLVSQEFYVVFWDYSKFSNLNFI